MNAAESVRLKTSKSRIPVSVKNKKSNENNEKSLKKLTSRAQTSNSSKTTNSCPLQKDAAKKINLQPSKLDKVSNDSKLKGKAQLSVRTNTKSSCTKEKELSVRPNTKSSCTKEKELSVRTNVKAFDIKEKSLLSKSKPKLDVRNGKAFPSLKKNSKCLNNVKGNQLTASDSIKKPSAPKIIIEKESKTPKMDYFAAQKDIKFEANEMYRNMILREKEMSPSVCNLLPGFRMSSILSQRPSIYQKLEIPQDPYKEAMKAIENISLSAKREYKSSKQFKTVSSPFKDRPSFYTPCSDPKREVMESLKKLKLKQLKKSASKSAKKVTFDLNITECTPMNAGDGELKSFKNCESRLTQINEKSEENTPNSPENERIGTTSLKENKENFPQTIGYKNEKCFINQQEVEATVTNDCIKYCTSRPSITSVTQPVSTSKSNDINSEKICSVESEKLSFHPVNKSSELTDLKNLDTSIKDQRLIDIQKLDQNNMNGKNVKVTQAKMYTPRPVSFYSQFKVMKSSSPEFLEKGTSEELLKFAPICTPLVLRSVSKSTELSPDIAISPVRLKLDFSEKETPRNKTPKKTTVVSFGNIVTHKSKLDELADEECCLLLLNESVPVVCGRYLTNPVADTLNEGDEMHFIPIIEY